MSKRVKVSVSNDIATDRRVFKFSTLLSESGVDVTVIGRKLPGSLPLNKLPFKCVRFNMFFKSSPLFYAFLNIRLFFYLLFSRFDVLIANDLDTLPANYLVSIIRRKKLIYDSHEYFTGVPELADRHFVRWVWKSIERAIAPSLKYIITVSDSIADLYREEYNSDVTVIRNVSERYNGPVMSRQQIGVGEDNLLLVLQGSGINMGTGGTDLIEAISKIDNVHLLIIGGGDMLKALKIKVQNCGYPEKFTFLPLMPWERMMSYTRAADVGVGLFKAGYINLDFCLPNKLFEYLSAGIAVLVNELKEIKIVVEKYNCGIIINDINVAEIEKAIIYLKENPVELKNLKLNSEKAFEELNWDTESGKFIALLARIGFYSC